VVVNGTCACKCTTGWGGLQNQKYSKQCDKTMWQDRPVLEFYRLS
jgi:hypothetical protein